MFIVHIYAVAALMIAPGFALLIATAHFGWGSSVFGGGIIAVYGLMIVGIAWLRERKPKNAKR